jgi:ankyrin repeat protein
MFASEFGRVEFVSILLSFNADVAAEDDDKCTALHLAARKEIRSWPNSKIKLFCEKYRN